MSSSVFLILAAVVVLASSVWSNSIASQDDAPRARQLLDMYFAILSPRNAFSEVCPIRSCQLPVDPELASWNFDLASMTENQLKALCREAKAQTTCYYQQGNNCIPSDFQPLIEPINSGLAKLFEICDQPSLYTDFQAIQTCAHSVIAQVSAIRHYSFLSSYTLTTLCPYASLIAGKSAVKELERVDAVANRWSWKPYRYSDSDSTTTTTTKAPSTVVVNATEFQHGACCAAKTVVECGLTTLVSETCSSEATAAIKRNLEHFLNSFNCPQITASRPCPLAINLAK